MPTQESAVLGGRYALQDVLGRGGMADVYRAEDTLLGRAVAVKVMRDVAADPRERERFAAEARTLARLNHPGLVPVLDAGISDAQPFLVMELVEGRTLADCCRGVALDPQRVAAIGAELARALAYVHASGLVHRDIKPGNILLDVEDRVRLTDFGIARLVSDTSGYTATGTTIGTAAYLAPEQVRGDRVTPAADIYAFGLVLIEALTGERVYRGSPAEAALARLSTPPAAPEGLSAGWRTLLQRMTADAHEQRPTAGEVSEALRQLAAGSDPATATAVIRGQRPTTLPLGQPAPQTSGSSRHDGASPGLLWRPRSRRAGAVTAALVVLLLLGGGLLISGRGSGADPAGRGPALPTGVPTTLQQPLRDLHDAVEGR